MKGVAISILLGTMFSPGSFAEVPADNTNNINLPGVERFIRDYDAKVAVSSKQFQEEKVAPLMEEISSLNNDIMAKCSAQEKLDQSCKTILVRQTIKQIELFKAIVDYNSSVAKIMEDKLKNLNKLP